MKLLILAMLALTSISAAFSQTIQYNCKCIDTGLECEGMEKMKVLVNQAALQAVISGSDGSDPYTINAALKSSQSKGPNLYKSVNEAIYTSISLTKGMEAGIKKGKVEMAEMSGHDLVHTWEFLCNRK